MKRRISFMMIFSMLMLSFVGCSSGSGNKGGNNGGVLEETLTVAMSGDAIALDPVATNDNQSSNVMIQIYEGLLYLGDDGQVKPLLAEKFEQKDQSTYVFTLRKGIKFHNGEELKANDVVFSLKRAIEAPNVKHLFNSIDTNTVLAKDDYTVEFKLSSPYSGVLAALCHPGAFIVNEKAVNEGGDNYKMNPVGTGPLKFVSWTKANEINLERFDDYHGDKVAYKNVKLRIIPEPTNRTIELETGGVDISYDIAENDISKVEGNSELKLLKSLDYGTTYLGFNCSKAPFDNPKVREAISYAIDMESIIKAVYLGVGKTATGPMPSTLKYSIADQLQVRKRDVAKAKELLKEAGFENGFQTTLSTNENKSRQEMATIIKQQLSEVGIDVSIKALEWSAFNDLLKNAQQDMFEIAWIADSPDADTFMFPCFHSSAKGAGGNYVYLEDKQLDELLEKARVEQNDATRADLYKKAQERVLEISAWVPQYNKELLVGTRKNIDGVKLSPFGWYKLTDVKKTEK